MNQTKRMITIKIASTHQRSIIVQIIILHLTMADKVLQMVVEAIIVSQLIMVAEVHQAEAVTVEAAVAILHL